MIEIQIVPSDIRRRVRYFFFDRRRVVVGICALSLLLAGIIGSMTAAPTVIRRVYKSNYLTTMRHERDIQNERLHENVMQMTSLEKSLEEHRIRVEKLITVYGLDRGGIPAVGDRCRQLSLSTRSGAGRARSSRGEPLPVR